MGGKQSIPKDRKIVVVGGGYGGMTLCVELQAAGADFLLVDEKTFFYHNVASVRAVVDTGIIEKLYIPYAETFGDNFKKGKVTQINTGDQQVTVDDGDVINYDVLVLATGCRTLAPFKYDPTVQAEDNNKVICNDYAEKVKNGKKIVIVGGGAVGCEIASEITSMYKDKDITLIHSGEKLLYPGIRSKLEARVQKKLKNTGVKLVLGQKATNLAEIDNGGQCEVATADGATYAADVVFKCLGNVQTDLTYGQDSLGNCFDEKGLLKVNEHLQVVEHNNIFAMGDCCNADVMKLAFLAQEHSKVVLHNIKALLNNTAMSKYKPVIIGQNDTFAVSLGPKDGELLFNGWWMPSFLIVSQKCKDMLVSKYWTQMKQKIPQ